MPTREMPMHSSGAPSKQDKLAVELALLPSPAKHCSGSALPQPASTKHAPNAYGIRSASSIARNDDPVSCDSTIAMNQSGDATPPVLDWLAHGFKLYVRL